MTLSQLVGTRPSGRGVVCALALAWALAQAGCGGAGNSGVTRDAEAADVAPRSDGATGPADALAGSADAAPGADAGSKLDAAPGGDDAAIAMTDAERGAPDVAGACPAGPTVVHFETTDGVRLEADLYPAAARGRLAVLLHMIPPSNDRRNYPAAFIEALVARGFTVLNVDRRGAGGSAGEPRAAYDGPDGWRDPAAALAFAQTTGCGVDPARVALVGASNGTTSVLDHAIEAGPPAAIVFLTGGAYTEKQHSLADARDALANTPIRFVFSTRERAWSVAFQADAPAAWTFDEYAPGDHGTRMFAARPEAITAVADFLGQSVP